MFLVEVLICWACDGELGVGCGRWWFGEGIGKVLRSGNGCVGGRKVGNCRSANGEEAPVLGSLRSLFSSHRCGGRRRKKIGLVLFKGRHSIEVAGGMGSTGNGRDWVRCCKCWQGLAVRGENGE